MKTRIAFAIIGAAVLASTVTTPAAISDPVKTDNGLIAGETLASGVRVFKGIPFGAPPIGNLRWREPQSVAKWDGVRDAKTWGNVCIQPNQPNRQPVNVTVDLPDSPKMNEDCLYLNVWTQANRANDRRPVMLWIFGGAYSEGGGSTPHNNGENLARKGVVLVTFNYRLGIFGFYAHPELTKESGRNASGNQALADAIATMRGSRRTSRTSAATPTTSPSSASPPARPSSACSPDRRSPEDSSTGPSPRVVDGWGSGWHR